MEMVERVQIDYMTVTKNNTGFKYFQAWERKSKFIDAQVYSHVKRPSAKRFVRDLATKSPFKIHSFQADGSFEFIGEFEEACAKLGISLIVLPPKKPTYSGGVERGNRTFREKF